MDDLEISLMVRKQIEMRRRAETDPSIDPSLYTPWGNMGLLDYREHEIKTDARPTSPADESPEDSDQD